MNKVRCFVETFLGDLCHDDVVELVKHSIPEGIRCDTFLLQNRRTLVEDRDLSKNFTVVGRNLSPSCKLLAAITDYAVLPSR